MQLTPDFTKQLKTVLNEDTEEQSEQLLTPDAIAVYDKYFFDRYLVSSYS